MRDRQVAAAETERRQVDDGTRHVYALTEDGEAIREPLRALARFGIQFLPEDAPVWSSSLSMRLMA